MPHQIDHAIRSLRYFIARLRLVRESHCPRRTDNPVRPPFVKIHATTDRIVRPTLDAGDYRMKKPQQKTESSAIPPYVLLISGAICFLVFFGEVRLYVPFSHNWGWTQTGSGREVTAPSILL